MKISAFAVSLFFIIFIATRQKKKGRKEKESLSRARALLLHLSFFNFNLKLFSFSLSRDNSFGEDERFIVEKKKRVKNTDRERNSLLEAALKNPN